MSTPLAPLGGHTAHSPVTQFVTVKVANQWVGIDVADVEDVIRPQPMTTLPLAPGHVIGVLNLRGRIVTALDLRQLLGMPPHPNPESAMSFVADSDQHLYSFLVDKVGDVLTLEDQALEPPPPNLQDKLRELSNGVFKLDKQLLIILQLDHILQGGDPA